ncbi:MAG: hypothetical protein QOE65_398 [Solirubrobacteraceae bacterium]|jgi:DNA-binding CsgD family transcriptional regulator|nr:hypothetical protein [Solirubrobacteraceae bacterium]
MATDRARERCRERVESLTRRPADPFELRFRIIELLRPVVGFERWCWPMCDPGSELGTTGIGEHDYWSALPRLLLLDQRPQEPNALPSLPGPRALGPRPGGLRFLDVLGPVGIGDELRVPLRDRHGLWGCLDLMRSSDERPFSETDREFLDELAPTLCAATRRSAAALAAAPAHEAEPIPPAGVLVVDSDLTVRASTPGARAWLARMVPPSVPFADIAASAVAFNVASRVLAGAGVRAARARVRTFAGAWAVVEADRLDPMEGTVAVTIRPAAARDVLDLRLLAYDLTDREREVATIVLEGSDIRAISERLVVSPHTVNDHLKSIYAKVGTRTRKELVATLAAPGAAG